MNIQERLRDAVTKLRRTPMPISDVIPLLQEAAATIDVLKMQALGIEVNAGAVDD